MASRLWRKAAAAVKDKSSIYLARVGRKRGFRNPELEAAIIKATSHDESFVDYKNAQRVFEWVRTSPNFLEPLIWALTKRVQKTRNWVVALKSLMLIHGLFCTKIPSVQKIGRLPFDLSNFHDSSSSPAKSLGYSAFVRAYYAFLDHHSTFLRYYHDDEDDDDDKKPKEGKNPLMKKTLQRLRHFQALLDLLLQIKPCTDRMEVALVLEALDCIVIEVLDLYSAICSGVITAVAQVVSAAAASEAVEVLQIAEKGTSQNSQLKSYLQLCREMGVLNATESPLMEPLSEDNIGDLERIVEGASMDKDLKGKEGILGGDDIEEVDLRGVSGTTVSEKWVVFDEDMRMSCRGASSSGFLQLHHLTENPTSLWEVAPFNENRISVVYSAVII